MFVTVVTMVNLDSGDNRIHCIPYYYMFSSIAGQYNLVYVVFSEYDYIDVFKKHILHGQ